MGSSRSTLDANQQSMVLGLLETSACGRSGSSVSAVMNGGSPMSSKKPVFDRLLIVNILSPQDDVFSNTALALVNLSTYLESRFDPDFIPR